VLIFENPRKILHRKRFCNNKKVVQSGFEVRFRRSWNRFAGSDSILKILNQCGKIRYRMTW
jgi:hypothetical protein